MSKCIYLSEGFYCELNAGKPVTIDCHDSKEHPCKHKVEEKKQTNADRIRNMTDEELAEYFYDICDCDHADVPCREYCGKMPCKDAFLKWMKQECNE